MKKIFALLLILSSTQIFALNNSVENSIKTSDTSNEIVEAEIDEKKAEKQFKTFIKMRSKMDNNFDARISESEAKGKYLRNFAKYDKNGDNYITEDEM